MLGQAPGIIQPKRRLLFFSDAFERLVVGFLVDEPSGIVIAFCPPIVLGIVDLAPILHCSNAVIVSIGFVLCHDDLLLLTFSRFEKVYFVLLADSKVAFEILISMPVLQARSLEPRGFQKTLN